jgi:hypothetical protein
VTAWSGIARLVTAACLTLLAASLVASPRTVLAAERSLSTTASYPVAGNSRVVVELTDHDVEIRAADIEEVRITTELAISGLGSRKADTWIAAHTPVVAEGPEELRVTSTPTGSGFLALGHLTARARLRIVVPATVVPDITTAGGTIEVRGDFPLADPLQLRTATGSMVFEGAASSIDVRTVSGDVRIDLLRPLERLFARTSSGSITLAGGTRAAEVDTASGDIRLDHLSGTVHVGTTTGTIALRWDRLDADDSVTVRSSSGKVSLTVPPSIEPSGTVTTTGGEIRCELASEVGESVHSLRLTGAGSVLDVETASGSVTIVSADAWEPPELP